MSSSRLSQLSCAALFFTGLPLASAVAQAPSPSARGVWTGTLAAGSTKLRLVFHLDPVTGACSIDSLDQGAKGIGCTDLKFAGSDLSLASSAIHGHFHGTLSPDGNTLTGTWSQGTDLPLTLTRETQTSQ